MRLLCLIGIVTLYVALTSGVEKFSSSDGDKPLRVNSLFKDVNNDVSPERMNKSLKIITRSSRIFFGKYYTSLVRYIPSSYVCSPLSLISVLSMLAQGARGNTTIQILELLALSNKNYHLAFLGFQSIIDSFDNYNEVELHVANKIFVDSGFSPRPKFIKYITNVFRSTVESLDLQDKHNASRMINKWFAGQTKNNSEQLFRPYHIGPHAAIVFASVVNFRGIWKSGFNPANTTSRLFLNWYGDERCIKTMYAFGYYRYGELPEINATFVEIPYKKDNSGSSISMFILKPNEKLGPQLLNNMANITVAKLIRASKRKVHLYLPKFTIKTVDSLWANLASFGMRDIFTIKSNFSRIVKSARLKFGEIMNYAAIEVNEEGDTAVDATGISYKRRDPRSNDEQRDIEFRADRPFVGIVATTGKIRVNVLTFQFTGEKANYSDSIHDDLDDTLCTESL